MKEKIINHLSGITNSVLLAGIILIFIGLYYAAIKAGIPYQDPPPELQIQYTVNLKIGEILSGSGFAITVCGGIIRFFLGLLKKHSTG